MSTATTNTTTVANADGEEATEIDERGRSRGNRRKRDSFFGTLKKRFSRSKVRSKSMEPGSRDLSMDRDMSVGRSVSMERTANRASEEEHENPSPLRDTLSPREFQSLLAVPASAGGDGGSTRSSLSDASAISSSSTRTYVNEASTLIVETRENGVLKHYLIPLSLQQKSKWRKKGLKLHVFNEHTFVAKHMSSTTPCQVCQKTLGRRFGKQGYECRDCGFKCHKPCHVKTDTVCPNSTVNTMDLEYIKDPREERKAWLKKVKAM
ncbi:protein kinase C-like 1 isoform X3 [Penaeus monodon]|uniref:protein kinase C-like 1 isoform X3 n=1 Tax=Penaeus monodon TaxID=6687 RepID=UPI0018A75451|nr:protein kinase C-like 1 isoform X3 [Penaeus monodon]